MNDATEAARTLGRIAGRKLKSRMSDIELSQHMRALALRPRRMPMDAAAVAFRAERARKAGLASAKSRSRKRRKSNGNAG